MITGNLAKYAKKTFTIMDVKSGGENTMENLENVLVEEVTENVAVEPTPKGGNKLVKGALIAGAAFGIWQGGKWIVKKIRARKAKNAANVEEETVEE